jgi:putative tryptophan/tyrosine transport system substrate-binding protein
MEGPMPIEIARRTFIAALGSAAAWSLRARAQQAAAPRRIGLLMAWDEGNPLVQSLLAEFREGLGKLGWIEGRNIKLEYRWTGNDMNLMQQGAKEIVASQPDLIFSSSSPTTAVLLAQTRAIPILFVNIIDPVGQGFVTSLSRPGGNATGLVNLEASMAGKWVELLKEVMPSVARVVVPFNPTSAPYADLYLNYFKSTAQSFAVEIIASSVADIAAFESLVEAQAREPNTGLIPMPSGFMAGHEIATVVTRNNLPAVSFNREFAQAGGLMAYGNDISDNYRRSATFVDRILKGEKPSDIPVQFPVKFDLVINLKTAKALGLQIPDKLLAIANEVIE